jgi:hypothetical protein
MLVSWQKNSQLSNAVFKPPKKSNLYLPLLHRRDSFFLFYTFLYPLNCISRLNINFYFLSSKSLHLDHNPATETENQMQSRFLLDVVVSKGTAIFKLLTSENKALLVRGNTFLVLNLSLDIFNGVGGFYFKGNSLTGEGLDEDLHTTTETEHQVKGRFFLNVVIGQSATIFKLLAGEDQTLLIRRNALLVLNFGLNILCR